MALDVAEAIYKPREITHIPGIANTIADQLSREFGLSAGGSCLAALKFAKRVVAPLRDATYNRTLNGSDSPP